jgi:hypothetical protein
MRRMIGIGVVAFVLLFFVLAQLFLPGIAAQQLRDRLSKNGQVLDVQVSAFPAIELLWHNADRVVVRMGRYRSSTGHLSSLLDEASGVGTLDASANVLTTGLLTLRNASLSKRGNELTGTASVTEADLRSAIPFLNAVTLVASGSGQLTLRGTGTVPVLGVTASVDATVAASNGRLMFAPNVPFLGTFTLFSDAHVQVQGVGANATPAGFTVSARAGLN